MFRGVQYINLDAKGRMAVPARQREQLSVICEGQMVMTVDTQSSCLALYPLPEWERIERDVQALPALNPAIKRFQRLVLGYASDLQLDGNGRVLVPPALREYAQLAKRDAACLRRAHQQAASSRAPAVSTHATPTPPSETSSAHLVVHCGRVSRIHNGGEWCAQAGRS